MFILLIFVHFRKFFYWEFILVLQNENQFLAIAALEWLTKCGRNWWLYCKYFMLVNTGGKVLVLFIWTWQFQFRVNNVLFPENFSYTVFDSEWKHNPLGHTYLIVQFINVATDHKFPKLWKKKQFSIGQFLAPLTFVRRSLSDTNLSGVRRRTSTFFKSLLLLH